MTRFSISPCNLTKLLEGKKQNELVRLSKNLCLLSGTVHLLNSKNMSKLILKFKQNYNHAKIPRSNNR